MKSHHLRRIGPYYAFSPYKNAISQCVFNIPSVQYAPKGTFSPEQMVSFAHSNDNHLTFYNAFSGIKFSVTHEGITKIVFKNRENSEPISGNMRIQFWNSFPENPGVIPEYSGVSNTLTVYPAEGKYFMPGEYYFASLRPGTTSLFISMYTETQVATIGLYTRWLERSKVVALREIDKNLTFKDIDNCSYATLGGNLLPTGIEKDAITEVVFHTSSDVTTDMIVPGSIPYYVSIGYYDIEYTPVYFEMVGSTAHFYTKAERYRMAGPECISFTDWHELKSVDLSMFNTEQVNDFQYMFENCINLESVDLSSFDTSNGLRFWGMFERCKKLKKLNISNFSSRSATPDLAPFNGIFNNCHSLVSLDLGDLDIIGSVNHSMFCFGCYCYLDTNSPLRHGDRMYHS